VTAPLLTISDVLERLNCGRDALARFRRDPDDPLPCINLRGMIRFDAAEVEAWIRRQSFKQPKAKGKTKKRRLVGATPDADRFLKGGR
jgi:predicted DNA-binding transcriptional regulator AlpA